MRFLSRPLRHGNYNSFLTLGDIDYRSYFREAIYEDIILRALAEIKERQVPMNLFLHCGRGWTKEPVWMKAEARDPRPGVLPLEVTDELVAEWDEARRDNSGDPQIQKVLEAITSTDDVVGIIRSALAELDVWYP